MPNNSFKKALKELFTYSDKWDVFLDTLEISHPGISDSLFLVNNEENWEMITEDNRCAVFSSRSFTVTPPTSGRVGSSEMTFEIDNADLVISRFFDRVNTDSKIPVSITRRFYVSRDLTAPQTEVPLTLFVTDVQVNNFVVSGRANFAGIINISYPTETYERNRFPSLGT